MVFGEVNIPSLCQNKNVYIKTFFIFHCSTIFVFSNSDVTRTHTIVMKKLWTVQFYLIKLKDNFYKQKLVPLRKNAFLYGTTEHNWSKILVWRILSSAVVIVCELVLHCVPTKGWETLRQLLIIRIQQGTMLTLSFKLKLSYQLGGRQEWRWSLLLTLQNWLLSKLHE